MRVRILVCRIQRSGGGVHFTSVLQTSSYQFRGGLQSPTEGNKGQLTPGYVRVVTSEPSWARCSAKFGQPLHLLLKQLGALPAEDPNLDADFKDSSSSSSWDSLTA